MGYIGCDGCYSYVRWMGHTSCKWYRNHKRGEWNIGGMDYKCNSDHKR